MNKSKADKEYVESLCKVTLEMFYPQKFSDLIKSESPDFYNDKYFVEVRRIILNDKAEFHSLYKKYVDKDFNEIPKPWLEKLGFNLKDFKINGEEILLSIDSNKVGSLFLLKNKNGKYNLCGLMDKSSTDDISDLIFDGLCEKLTKLQKYQKGDENDIFFYVEDFMYFQGFSCFGQIISHLKEKIKNSDIFTKYSCIFDFIYLLFNDSLTVFNLKTLICCDHKKLEQKDWDEIRDRIEKL